jgi:hypothetical protein
VEWGETRTRVDGREILEWREEEHGDDAHAKDLHAPAGHVQHERLHGQRLERRDRKLPCFLLLQCLVRAQRFNHSRSRRHRGGGGGGGLALSFTLREGAFWIISFLFNSFSFVAIVRIAPLTLLGNLVEQEACSICEQNVFMSDREWEGGTQTTAYFGFEGAPREA